MKEELEKLKTWLQEAQKPVTPQNASGFTIGKLRVRPIDQAHAATLHASNEQSADPRSIKSPIRAIQSAKREEIPRVFSQSCSRPFHAPDAA
ncbi:hypothetical protein [Jeongeupia chitinilytica]|uniref:hypothetical protein n=1 Tax=Jeongeupia chitinilytica TaxID=1041641 RepID=UPI00167506B6|nr:hypothetical protein [Jeongeupia chitinilytica]